MRTYYVYLIECGNAKYVGSTNNYEKRMNQHKKDLKLHRHCNNKLQSQYDRGNYFQSSVIEEFKTNFKKKVLMKEQQYINKYSNSNEATAAKSLEGMGIMNIIDFVENHKKVVFGAIFVILVACYGLTFDQAQEWVLNFIKFLGDI